MDNEIKFIVGEEVAIVASSYSLTPTISIKRIKSITDKRGDITLEGEVSRKFYSNGAQKDAGYYPCHLEKVELKHHMAIEKNRVLDSIARMTNKDWAEIDLASLNKVEEVIKAHLALKQLKNNSKQP